MTIINPGQTPEVERRIQAATGYLQLGMVGEAHAEVQALPPEVGGWLDVLCLRACIYAETDDWEALYETAGVLSAACPEEPRIGFGLPMARGAAGHRTPPNG